MDKRRLESTLTAEDFRRLRAAHTVVVRITEMEARRWRASVFACRPDDNNELWLGHFDSRSPQAAFMKLAAWRRKPATTKERT